MSERESSSKRVVYLDVLRILATLAVVILHIAAWNWHTTETQSTIVLHWTVGSPGMTDFRSFEWGCLNVWDAVVRWSVPVFLMISGALFLSPKRQLSAKKLYAKNILRIVTAFLFWSAVYALYTWHVTSGMLKQDLFVALFQGHFHMWYLFVVVGLYMITPLLRLITARERSTKYFLGLSFVFSIAIPSLESLAGAILAVYPEPHLALVNSVFANDVNAMAVTFVVGYSFYYVLGYYLSVHRFSGRALRGICTLGLLGFVLTAGLTEAFTLGSGATNESFYDFFSLTVFLEAIGVFEFFKTRRFNPSPRVSRWIATLSNWTFGVYLVHMLVIEVLADRYAITALAFNPVVSVPILAVAVFAVGMLVSGVLHQIPALRKYVV